MCLASSVLGWIAKPKNETILPATAASPSVLRRLSVFLLPEKALTEVGPEWLHHPVNFDIAMKRIKTGNDGFRSLFAML